MFKPSKFDHRTELQRLHVPVVTAGREFRNWLKNRAPAWDLTDDFADAIPSEWVVVKQDGYDLCQLASQREIVQMSKSSTRCGLLPIGGLIDGSILVLDMLDNELMRVGAVGSDHVMSTSGPQIDRKHYSPLPFAYGEWLAHIRQHPFDVRYR